ncbi:MAG: hypothetical protein H6Q18_483 [Bacteroidetes bacterium]|nr:hypothetical protein [Bacteroidota bacterium]
MKRALTQAFTKVDENLICEFHVTFKKQLFTHESLRIKY